MKAITPISFAAALGVGLALSNAALAEPFNNRSALFADSASPGSLTTPLGPSGRVALGGFNDRGPRVEIGTGAGAATATPWPRERVVARASGGFNKRGTDVFSTAGDRSYDFDNPRVVQNLR